MKILIVLAILLGAVADLSFGANGLGTLASSVVAIVALMVYAVKRAIAESKARREAEARRAAERERLAKTPIFAPVPKPGEPGYDPNYDPDDDKYWRRYYN
ncbi:MAG: hypothetical protein IT343_21890 [Candidatus Melainabacteria bacterium]|nr:hypothetical protein [Candidatus Melainabacteria bacterium]